MTKDELLEWLETDKNYKAHNPLFHPGQNKQARKQIRALIEAMPEKNESTTD